MLRYFWPHAVCVLVGVHVHTGRPERNTPPLHQFMLNDLQSKSKKVKIQCSKIEKSREVLLSGHPCTHF